MNYDIKTIRNRYQMVPRTLIFIEKDQYILTIHKNNAKSFGYGKINNGPGKSGKTAVNMDYLF